MSRFAPDNPLIVPRDQLHRIHPKDSWSRGPFELRFGEVICGGIMPYTLCIDGEGGAHVTVQVYTSMTAVHDSLAEPYFIHERELTTGEQFVLRDGIHPETIEDLAKDALTEVLKIERN